MRHSLNCKLIPIAIHSNVNVKNVVFFFLFKEFSLMSESLYTIQECYCVDLQVATVIVKMYAYTNQLTCSDITALVIVYRNKYILCV